MSSKLRASFLLFFTAFIWGSAFVAQRVGMDHIGPFTFNGIRMLIGAVVLLPVVLFLNAKEKRSDKNSESVTEDKKTLYIGGICCGVVLFFASTTQQVGLLYTTAGKAGFITALYIIFVPILGLFMKKRVSKIIWLCVALACVGIYLLCMDGDFSMGKGDFIVLFCAIGYALHIIVIDYFSPKTNGVKMADIQFFVCAFISFIPMFIFESPKLHDIIISWIPLLYAGALSCAIGYTLQIVAQKDLNPTVTALILSFESVFAVIAEFVILREVLSIKEIIGCLLMFTAIIAAQLPAKPIKETAEGEIHHE